MDTNSAHRIALAISVTALSFWMSACVYHGQGPEAFRISDNHTSQLASNDLRVRCDEQTRLLKHEIALCRSVPLVTVPLRQ